MILPSLKRYCAFLIILTLCLQGCEKNTGSHRVTLSDAEKKFIKICNEENKLSVKLFKKENTVWIYLPMEEDLIDYHGTQKNDALKSKRQFTLSTFEGTYTDQDRDYIFVMDLAEGIKTAKDPSYKSDATEAFIKNRLTIYGAISEAYFDVGELPGDRHFVDKARDQKRQDMLNNYVPGADKPPEFFVIVVANVKKGIAYKTVLNLNDYKLYRSEVITSEEYNMREISELYGDDKLINDKEGKSLTIESITWPWFFIEQIKNRVSFKFTRSDFLPEPGKDIIIVTAGLIADTFRYYEYVDYNNVAIKNLRDSTTYNFNRVQITSFEEISQKPFIPTINFKYLLPSENNTP